MLVKDCFYHYFLYNFINITKYQRHFVQEKTQISGKIKNQDLWIHLLIYVWGTMPSIMENRIVNQRLMLTSKKLSSEVNNKTYGHIDTVKKHLR